MRTIAGSAAILLLVGAGCAGSGTVDTQVDTSLQAPPAGDDMMEGGIEAGADGMLYLDSSEAADAAVDAYLDGAAAEEAELQAEESETASLETDTEINAYGQAYDKNEF